MKTVNRYPRLLALLAAAIMIFTLSGTAHAIDDGARAYWNAREGTHLFSFQYLRLDMGASDALQFDPALFIYPNADVEANVGIANYAHHMSLFDRAASFGIAVIGGNAQVDFDADVEASFLPPGAAPGVAFSESSFGYADPGLSFAINLYGTRKLKSTVDLLNYEPGLTLDAALMLMLPVGEYDSDRVVNMGLNRLYGRIAFPVKYHFGVFSPGYMSSLELVPSVWLFGENDDFVGQKLENDPLFQFEAHLTHDFAPGFFGSIDMLFRSGFQSTIEGVDVGDELDIGDLGFTLNYQATDNLTLRNSFSSNVFGDGDLNNSLLRIQFVYSWQSASENAKKLMHGH
jgi:hypothetical protein